MRKIESECVCCDIPCIGSSCSLYEVTHYYCDRCGDETKLYYYGDEELCADCILKEFEVVDESEFYWL